MPRNMLSLPWQHLPSTSSMCKQPFPLAPHSHKVVAQQYSQERVNSQRHNLGIGDTCHLNYPTSSTRKQPCPLASHSHKVMAQ